MPLRAAHARVLIEQTIGRGLRLPYGRRTGVAAVDRLNIVAHDRFDEIVSEASRPNSSVRLQQVVLKDADAADRFRTIVSHPRLLGQIGVDDDHADESGLGEQKTAFSHDDREIAALVYDVVRGYESKPDALPSVRHLNQCDIQGAIAAEVARRRAPQIGSASADILSIVARTTKTIADNMIDIPRILVVPSRTGRIRFRDFTLDLSETNFQIPSETLWAAHLRTGEVDRIGLWNEETDDSPPEDILVNGLIAMDDIAYDDHADLLHDLAGQAIRHFRNHMSDADLRKLLRVQAKEIIRIIHAQMQRHVEVAEAGSHDVQILRGFTALLPSAYTLTGSEPPLHFSVAPPDKAHIARYVYGGFSRCLYALQKFQSDAERKIAVILEREALKWFKPAPRQFQLYYRADGDHLEYQPDFVAEMSDRIYMIEPKETKNMTSADVIAKKQVAKEWCRHASDYAACCGGKPWTYLLVPDDAIAVNMTIDGLARRYSDQTDSRA